MLLLRLTLTSTNGEIWTNADTTITPLDSTGMEMRRYRVTNSITYPGARTRLFKIESRSSN